jgi:hypothetical protein
MMAPAKKTPKSAAGKQVAPKQVAPKQVAPKQTAPKQKQAVKYPSTFHPLDYMTEKELDEVDTQLASALAGAAVVLFWTGVDWAHAQKWANTWGIKTLTMAMGPLMDPNNPSSPKAQKGKSYSRYVKGASGRFAQYASQHCRVIVLTNPPPRIYSSRQNNTYQRLEEPILKGHFGGVPVRRIDYLHPAVDGAAHITYQIWPHDKTQDWTASFGKSCIKKWKELNWSYKSLLTMSQLKLTMVEQDKAKDGNVTRLSDSVHTDSGRAPTTTLNAKGHESRDVDHLPAAGVFVGSDSERIESQVHNQVERGVDFHEGGILEERNHPETSVYVIERCLPPALPLTVPVISINDLTIGVDMTVEIIEHRSRKDFLYLTMRAGPEVKCWKLRWD